MEVDFDESRPILPLAIKGSSQEEFYNDSDDVDDYDSSNSANDFLGSDRFYGPRRHRQSFLKNSSIEAKSIGASPTGRVKMA